MKELFIDVETFSSRDLSKCGVYKYTEADDFTILLFGYSIDGGEVQVVDLAIGEKLPDEIRAALTSDAVIKIAHNANFERVCLSRFLGLPPHTYLPPSQWLCTMTWAAYMGLPLSLAGVGAVLGLDKKKMEEGRELIRYFCTSRDGTRKCPWDAPEKWELFKAYNKRDVEVELRIKERLSGFPVPDEVWTEYHLDQEINDRGVGLDMTLVRNAIAMDTLSRQELREKAKKLTDLENPNSVHQMLGWLSRNGVETDNLAKKQVKKLIDEADGEVREVLRLRQQLAKSSVRKYQAMANAVCSDGRARGMFMFYGANRTGRYSGRIIQLQNLRQNHLPDLAQARELVRKGDIETVKMLYEDVPDTLSQLVRTAFVPEPPNLFFVADFSAIEARVLSWLAGEKWRMDVFASGGDIYCATASRMFGVPVEKHGANAELRQKGKQAELSCGYGGSVGALKAMGAVEAGMKEEELKPLVEAWRAASPNIVRFWHEVERAAQKAAFKKTVVKLRNLTFAYRSGFLFITLPSGRNLAYVKPKRGENRFGEEALTYEGIGTTKKWERIETFGGKLVENCLAEGTLVITDFGLMPIEQVTPDMKLWDGIEWVAHDGVVFKGVQPVLDVDGIEMTPEHKILTEKGWMECVKANSGFNWSDVSLPDSYRASGKHTPRESAVALPVCMRPGENNPICVSQRFEKPHQILRMYEAQTYRRGQNASRNEPSSGIRGLAQHEAAMRRSQSSRLSQLRRARHKGVPSMGTQLPTVLGGYGADMEKGIGFGPYRQQSGLQPRKLSLGHQKNQLPKSENIKSGQFSIRRDDGSGIIRADGDWNDNAFLQNRTRLASAITVLNSGCQKPVYDILNAGPRHRFTVWNGERACIVSNCVQAISRDILCYALKSLREYKICMHVHDEVVIEAPEGTSLEEICEVMGRTPPWAEGLVLRADGFVTPWYKKD